MLTGSGFTNWPFMSVHTWGENPLGKWTLEIHNDAYSNWGSEAKFFRWSLKLYGTTFDPNSEASDTGDWYDDSEENLIERRIIKEPNYGHNHTERDWTPPTTSSTTTRTTSVRTTTTSSWTSAPSRLAPTVSEMRGCVSTTVNCTTDIDNCRTFSHRKVAKIFCQCLPKLCLGVSHFNREYNLQCSTNHPTQLSSSKLPFYCQFIPFLSNAEKKR